MDQHGRMVLAEQDVIEMMYRGSVKNTVLIDNPSVVIQAKTACADMFDQLEFDIETWQNDPAWADQARQNWFLPEDYARLDIYDHFAKMDLKDYEFERIAEELVLYQERELFPMLRFLIYLVKFMREHKIVYGVGRGSSVASYCLYLIGLHKVNSIQYGLDIKEFLK